jgi:polyketide cyclase/dehydrase/lipid transport protein
LDRTVRAEVAGSPQRCVVLLADVEGWPRWARLVRDVERRGDDLVMRAEVLGLTVQMRCVLERSAGGAILRRLPNETTDEERFTAAFTVRPADGGAAVTLQVAAAIDVPGPAGLLRGRIERRLADDLLADFAAAVAGEAG